MAIGQPFTIYLDSSDYSRLSSPSSPTTLQRTRDRLLEIVALPDVRFVFSGVHLSEMAPLESRFTDFAAARTDLLVALCKRNALISFDSLIAAEIDQFRSRDPTRVVAIRNDGTWFPDVGQIATPAQCLQVGAIEEKAHEMGLNRQARRSLKRQATKRKFRTELADHMGGDLSDVISRFPMREQDAAVLVQFVLGNVSAQKADEAFLESLRDPRWMMRWFHEHHDRLGAIGDWIREPARKLTGDLSDIVEFVGQTLRHEVSTGQNISGDILTATGWSNAQDKLVLDVLNRVAADGAVTAPAVTDVKLADALCPGFATCIRVAHSSLRNSIGQGARRLAQSDFVDAAHAMYAPYVDFFRTDRYMAPIIGAQTAKYGTAVIAKLEELPERIEAALASRLPSSAPSHGGEKS